ncbi:MAG: universal stress protein [Synechococcales bacterium]|jgi:nucleotide-binding universal stress UspA family protein|nr:universal stress protein [Cyanobacteria bacterium REEB444]MEB3124191.1 universal stress protein [Synechococcales bacterium]
MFKTVLYPIDHSLESLQAAETVVKIVEFCNSNLVLLSVVTVPEGEDQGQSVSPQAIADLLERAQALFVQQGIAAKVMEREGKPAFVICDVADETNADVIIMGCRGLGLTEEGVADSVTNRVINLSPCPVLVVP